MALAFTDNDTPDINSGTDAASYLTASWTPATGIHFCGVHTRENAGNNDWHATSPFFGNSMSWVRIVDLVFGTSNRNRLTWWMGDNGGGGATTGQTTLQFAQTNISCNAQWFYVTDLDITGGELNGIIQTPSNSGTGTSGSVTLAAAAHADNRPVVIFAHEANEATTPDGAWTEYADASGAGPARAVESQWKADAFSTSASASWTTSSAWGAIALELKATVAAGTADPFPYLTSRGYYPTQG